MSAAAIRKKYPGEWVLVAEPVSDKHLKLLRGRVAFHSKDRDEMYHQAATLRLPHFATLYTGAWPKDREFLL
jgi:hypothetical protein